MPGIVGFQGASDYESAVKLLDAMVEALGIEENSKVDSFIDHETGFARVHLNIVDKQPQPLWSADGNVAVIMTGEIFSWDGFSLDKQYTGKEPDFSNAEVLLAAYASFGDCLAEHVNGTFAAAMWDKAEHTLLLITDPLSSYPLYYAQVGELLVFGSGARCVAEAPGLRLALDAAAMADLMVFEHVYGDKTLFSGVRLLLPGTVLRFQRGKASLSTYIDFQYSEYYEMCEEEHYVELWSQYMRQAVARQTRGPAPLGVLLTGGLDSRTIAGVLAAGGQELRTITFGIPGCDDETAARQLAHLLHLPHKSFVLPADYLTRLGAKAVRLTDGQKSVVHLNMIGALAEIVREARVLYKGYLGGTIHGYVVSHDRLAPVREEIWFEDVFAKRNRLFPERDLPQVFTDHMYREVRDVPRQSLHQALARSHSTWWVDKDSYVDMYQEDARFTIMGVELARSQALVRTPMVDKDLLRFTMSVPPGFRVNMSYYRKAIIKAFPELAKVVYSATRRPIDEACFRGLWMNLDEQARWWLRNRGLKWVPVQQARPYADYATWMRHELRHWLEAILLSPQSLERGNFRPAYVRNLVAEHMAGYDHSRRLGMLIALELWYRQFVD